MPGLWLSCWNTPALPGDRKEVVRRVSMVFRDWLERVASRNLHGGKRRGGMALGEELASAQRVRLRGHCFYHHKLWGLRLC